MKKTTPTRKPRAAAARRKPGRPGDGGEGQRERLLDATAVLLGRDGYAGMTLRALAARARVTPALVNYYFGNKSRLLEAFLKERITPVFLRIAAPVAAAFVTEALPLSTFIRTYTTTMMAEPWLPPILAREVLAEGGTLRERFLRHFARPLAGRVPALIAAAQKRGELRADLDPQLIALSLISLLVFPVIAAPIMRDALGLPAREDFAATLIRHTTAVLMHGVEPRHG